MNKAHARPGYTYSENHMFARKGWGPDDGVLVKEHVAQIIIEPKKFHLYR